MGVIQHTSRNGDTGNPLASSKMSPISEIMIVINVTKQRIKASEFPVEKQIALGLISIIALEFMGLESSSIALVLPRYVLVAIISVLGDGFQICKDSYTQNTLAKIRSKFSFLSFVTPCLDASLKSIITASASLGLGWNCRSMWHSSRCTPLGCFFRFLRPLASSGSSKQPLRQLAGRQRRRLSDF